MDTVWVLVILTVLLQVLLNVLIVPLFVHLLGLNSLRILFFAPLRLRFGSTPSFQRGLFCYNVALYPVLSFKANCAI